MTLLFTLLFPSLVFASGKTAIEPGDILRVEAESRLNTTKYTWTTSQNGEILDSYTDDTFELKFPDAGEYRVNVLSENQFGDQKKTHFDVLVSENISTLLRFFPVLSTLPEANTEGTVTLSPSTPNIMLYGANSRGEVQEYRIDTNIEEDSDGDGDPANDIDNENHESLTTGEPWEVSFENTQDPITLRLTIIGENGEQKSTNITVDFAEKEKGETIEAKVDSLPPASKNGEIYVTGESAKITLLSSESLGDLVQYRIDTNIEEDSDGDGDPANDIDNENHPSFVNGEAFSFVVEKANGLEQILQLTVVGANQTGSKILRKIVFVEETDISSPPLSHGGQNTPLSPKLLVDRLEIFTGAEVTYHVVGIPGGAEYYWDFDGDGSVDAEGKASSGKYIFENPGEFTSKVKVVLHEKEVTKTEVITVREEESGEQEASPPIADFSYTLDDNKITFQNLSRSDPRLSNGTLVYDWDLGDGNTSTHPEPQHIFAEEGGFSITLKTTDSTGQVSKKTLSITVEEVTYDPATDGQEDPTNNGGYEPTPDDNGDKDTNEETPPEDEKNEKTTEEPSFSFPWGKIFLILLIFLLVGFIALLVVRKVQMPDLTFGEILQEEWEKWFGEGREFHEPISNISNVTKEKITEVAPHEPLPQQEEIIEAKPAEKNDEPQESPEEIQQNSSIPEDQEEAPPLAQEDGKTPDWLKTEESSAETETPSSEGLSPQEETPSNWLQSEENTTSPEEKSATETPTWLQENTPETSSDTSSQKDDLSVADTPDWLKTEEAVTETAPANNMQEEAPPLAQEDGKTPDWLETEESSAENTEHTESSDVSTDPSWLQSDSTESQPSSSPVEANTEETPEWLQESKKSSSQGDSLSSEVREKVPDWLKSEESSAENTETETIPNMETTFESSSKQHSISSSEKASEDISPITQQETNTAGEQQSSEVSNDTEKSDSIELSDTAKESSESWGDVAETTKPEEQTIPTIEENSQKESSSESSEKVGPVVTETNTEEEATPPAGKSNKNTSEEEQKPKKNRRKRKKKSKERLNQEKREEKADEWISKNEDKKDKKPHFTGTEDIHAFPVNDDELEEEKDDTRELGHETPEEKSPWKNHKRRNTSFSQEETIPSEKKEESTEQVFGENEKNIISKSQPKKMTETEVAPLEENISQEVSSSESKQNTEEYDSEIISALDGKNTSETAQQETQEKIEVDPIDDPTIKEVEEKLHHFVEEMLDEPTEVLPDTSMQEDGEIPQEKHISPEDVQGPPKVSSQKNEEKSEEEEDFPDWLVPPEKRNNAE